MKQSLGLKIVVTAAVVLAMAGGFVALANWLSKPTPEPEPEPSSAPVAEVEDKSLSEVQSAEETPSRNQDPYYVLVVGNDSRIGTVGITEEAYANGKGRSDVVILMRIDPATYTISLLSFPRETPITYNGEKRRFNTLYSTYGIQGTKDGIEQKTGLKISYTIDIGMPQFVDFINAIGGIDVEAAVPVDFEDIITGEHIYVDAGQQHLNGNEALVFSRVRKAYAYGDAARQNNNRRIIMNLIKKVAADPDQAIHTLDLLLLNIKTDWPVSDLKQEVDNFVAHADQITFQEGTGPYDGAYSDEYGAWVCFDDPQLWADILKAYSAGEDPTQVYALAPMYAK